MKRICAGASLLLVLAVPAPAHSENGYKLTSTTLDGGGGESRSPDDRFRLIGTIGQADAGKLEGGTYRLNGGFWGCQSSSPPVPEPLAQKDDEVGPISYKNRFISVTTSAADAGRGQAIRVRFVSLPPPFDIWNDEVFFVGKPHEVCENSGKGLETDPADCPAALPTDTFWAAPLLCEKDKELPHYMDWHGWCDKGTCVGGLKPNTTCAADDDCVEYVHLYHEGIVPSKMLTPSGPIDIPAVYHVQVLDYTCPDADIYYSSPPLVMQQAGWGDVCGPGPGGACKGVADGIVDVTNDVLGVLDKFANVNNLQKARADLEPNLLDFKINVAMDVLHCLAAFGGAPYPFAPKAADPCDNGLKLSREGE